jgi:hypothetical protein
VPQENRSHLQDTAAHDANEKRKTAKSDGRCVCFNFLATVDFFFIDKPKKRKF